MSWNDRLPKFELDSDLPLQVRTIGTHQPFSPQACLVHNSETIRIKYFLDILVDLKFPVMLIGAAGSGKTLIINEKLGQMDEEFLIANVPFNFYYNSELTQKILEKPLEKKVRGKEYPFLNQNLRLPNLKSSFLGWQELRTTWQQEVDLLPRRHEHA